MEKNGSIELLNAERDVTGLPGCKSGCKVFQVNRQCRLDSATSDNNVATLENTLDNAQRVVHRAFHFITVEVIGTS